MCYVYGGPNTYWYYTSADGVKWLHFYQEVDDSEWKRLGGVASPKHLYSKHVPWDPRTFGHLSDKTSFTWSPFLQQWMLSKCVNIMVTDDNMHTYRL